MDPSVKTQTPLAPLQAAVMLRPHLIHKVFARDVLSLQMRITICSPGESKNGSGRQCFRLSLRRCINLGSQPRVSLWLHCTGVKDRGVLRHNISHCRMYYTVLLITWQASTDTNISGTSCTGWFPGSSICLFSMHHRHTCCLLLKVCFLERSFGT